MCVFMCVCVCMHVCVCVCVNVQLRYSGLMGGVCIGIVGCFGIPGWHSGVTRNLGVCSQDVVLEASGIFLESTRNTTIFLLCYTGLPEPASFRHRLGAAPSTHRLNRNMALTYAIN